MDNAKNQRIRDLVAELKKRHTIRNQSHFAEIIGSDRATISEIIHDHIDIPNNLFGKILDKFPFINPSWLKYGEGPMMITATHIGDNTVSADHNSQASVNYYGSSEVADLQKENERLRRELDEAKGLCEQYLTIIKNLTTIKPM